jgi:ClpP class serine protease
MRHLLNKIASSRWAITPEALEAIWKLASREWTAADYETFHAASKGDLMALTADLGEPLGESRNAFVRGDTGILLLDGPIIPRADNLDASSGLIGINRISEDFRTLEADDSVKRIMLLLDTPGGEVTGIADFAAMVRASEKETVSFVYGMAASAGYWIGSAADTVVSTTTGLVGSIGVVSIFRKDDDDTIEIVSDQSPLKRADPDTDAGKASIQEMLNDLADVFVQDVAVNMGVKPKKVLADFGQGAVMVAARAQAAGMIDSINTLDGLMSSFEKPAPGGDNRRIQMNLTQFLAENPAAAAELEGRLKAEFDRGKADGEEVAKAKSKTLIARVQPYLAADSPYGETLKALSLKVIEGSCSIDALDTVIAIEDMKNEREKSAQAQAETEEVGETTSEAPENLGTTPDGELSAKQEAAMIAADRKRRGLPPLEA